MQAFPIIHAIRNSNYKCFIALFFRVPEFSVLKMNEIILKSEVYAALLLQFLYSDAVKKYPSVQFNRRDPAKLKAGSLLYYNYIPLICFKVYQNNLQM